MKFFQNCHTLAEVKKLYRDLAKQHHPDKGGHCATMQQINSEYIIAIARAAREEKNYKGQDRTDAEVESEILKAQAYQEAVNKTVHLEGCTLELVGCWLWITGNTKPFASILKNDPAKFKWAKKKTDFSAWFFRTDEYKMHNNRKKLTLDEIREKYGSQTIKENSTFQLT